MATASRYIILFCTMFAVTIAAPVATPDGTAPADPKASTSCASCHGITKRVIEVAPWMEKPLLQEIDAIGRTE